MTAVNRADDVREDQTLTPVDESEAWVNALSTPGPVRDTAIRRLHELMLRAARHQVAQMYTSLPALGHVRIQDIVNQAADDATVAVLSKLASFEGRSRFTTWAYKFGILHAAVEVRRNMWRHREVNLDLLADPPSIATSPEQFAQGTDFARAVQASMDTSLTAHQRRVVQALLVEDVPVDVLADRLGATRNALYKTLHDARVQLRKDLTAKGYLTAKSSLEVK